MTLATSAFVESDVSAFRRSPLRARDGRRTVDEPELPPDDEATQINSDLQYSEDDSVFAIGDFDGGPSPGEVWDFVSGAASYIPQSAATSGGAGVSLAYYEARGALLEPTTEFLYSIDRARCVLRFLGPAWANFAFMAVDIPIVGSEGGAAIEVYDVTPFTPPGVTWPNMPLAPRLGTLPAALGTTRIRLDAARYANVGTISIGLRAAGDFPFQRPPLPGEIPLFGAAFGPATIFAWPA